MDSVHQACDADTMDMMRPKTPCQTLPGILAALTATATASAQQGETPVDGDDLKIRRSTPTEVRPVEPDTLEPPTPGLTSGRDWLEALKRVEDLSLPEAMLLREGTFLAGRAGRLVEAPTGHLIFVPDPETRGAGEGPMLLLPNRLLERLERARWLDETLSAITMSAEIFEYHGRNYALLNAWNRSAEPEPEEPTESTPVAEQDEITDEEPAASAVESPAPQGADESPTDADPSVEALMQDLLTERRGPIGIAPGQSQEPTAGSRAGLLETDEQGAESILPQRDMITRQRGRLTRSSSGEWTVAIEGDDLAQPLPMVLMPSRTVMRIERQALQSGGGLPIVVSGRVQHYHGKLYLVPTLVQTDRDDDFASHQ